MTVTRFQAQPFEAFVIGMLTDVRTEGDLVAYLSAIDDTLAPYGGRFAIHGGNPAVLEGTKPEFDLIAIGVPTRAAARDWYASDAYQRLVPLRQAFAQGDLILYAGEDDEHHAADILNRSAPTTEG